MSGIWSITQHILRQVCKHKGLPRKKWTLRDVAPPFVTKPEQTQMQNLVTVHLCFLLSWSNFYALWNPPARALPGSIRGEVSWTALWSAFDNWRWHTASPLSEGWSSKAVSFTSNIPVWPSKISQGGNRAKQDVWRKLLKCICRNQQLARLPICELKSSSRLKSLWSWNSEQLKITYCGIQNSEAHQLIMFTISSSIHLQTETTSGFLFWGLVGFFYYPGLKLEFLKG